MTRDEAVAMLEEYAAVAAGRDARVRAAVAAGLSKLQVHQITGIGRMTIDRILAQDHVPGTSLEGESGR